MITALNHITLAVTNLDDSFDFYHKILRFKPLVKWDKGAYFLIGEGGQTTWFCLNVDPQRIPSPCYTHYAFTVSKEDFKRRSEHLLKTGVKTFKENTSPGDSLYFLDPDGHKLEIHSSNWQERVQIKKETPGNWQNVEWFI